MLKNCCRCGLDYKADDRRRNICPSCHTVRGLAKNYAGQPLSPREKEVVEFVRQGMTNKEIAYRLHLKTGTIKDYMVTIFIKCAVPNRVALAIMAERLAVEPARVPAVDKTSETLKEPELTGREKQVSDLVRQAMRNTEIAVKLHLTAGTVSVYLSKILHKLKLRDRVSLAMWVVEHGNE